MKNGYSHFGVMLDCSRNAVMKPQAVRAMIDALAKMGYNTLELYAEDTYEVEGEPYFGYMRGRYTGAELKELDAYAASKGVELIPCIQTLAHFTNPVKLPRYIPMTDVNDIFLADDERTYELIDRIFASLAKNFTSRRVNIGMDEAHMVGLGRYLDEHGYCNRTDILCRHLGRVTEIAAKYGFTPHMWSDMFFRLANKGEYYVRDGHISAEVRKKVPAALELTYWDYYHTEKAVYDDMIAAHKEFDREIWFAGGAWTWNGFAPFNAYSLATMRPAMESVAQQGIRNVLITMWGDNGKECSFFAVLPALYAIRRYADGIFDEKEIADGFEKLFGVSYADFMLLDLPNRMPCAPDGVTVENPCKSLLFSDCFTGIFDDDAEKKGKIPYGEYAGKLSAAASRAGEFAYIFREEAELCSVLELKATLGVRIRKAYRAGDKKALAALADDCGRIEEKLRIFWQSFRNLWDRENKPFGFEVQDARLGGLMLRVRHCGERLRDYAEGKVERIEELEADVLPFFPDRTSLQLNNYRMLVSFSEL